MTIITVKDGVMAVDSVVTTGGIRLGEIVKYSKVPECMGGGWIAGSGDAALANKMMQAFINGADTISERVTLVWMNRKGEIHIYEGGSWLNIKASFYAEGTGYMTAMGAMAYGASATEAAIISCELSDGCGGTIFAMEADSITARAIPYEDE